MSGRSRGDIFLLARNYMDARYFLGEFPSLRGATVVLTDNPYCTRSLEGCLIAAAYKTDRAPEGRYYDRAMAVIENVSQAGLAHPAHDILVPGRVW